MKILSARITNFGSLRDVTLKDLDDLNIFVGRNGSGKSLTFHALDLFFREFELLGGQSAAQLNDCLWHRRRTQHPIVLELLLELSPQETDAAAGTYVDVGPPLGVRDAPTVLEVSRELHFGQGWRTRRLVWGELEVVAEDQPGAGVDSNAALVELLQRSFRLIPAARDAPTGTASGESLIATQIYQRMVALPQSVEVSHEAMWHSFKRTVESGTGRELESLAGDLRVSVPGFRLPLLHTGGGEQAFMSVVWQVLDSPGIVAVEEPESHLHPELSRALFAFLKGRGPEGQVFISTHDAVFVDKEKPSRNWAFRCDDRVTAAVSRLESTDDLKRVFAELGVLASDVLFADLMVFVEGSTEKEAVLPIWAATLGLEMAPNPRIGVVSLGGSSNATHYLKVWLEVAEFSNTDYLVVLDAHPGDELLKITREAGIPEERVRVWSKQCIEDYYPPRLVVEALRVLFSVEATPQDLKGDRRDRAIKRILEKAQKIRHGWKVSIGQYVASQMTEQEIPQEAKGLFEGIKARLL